MQPYRGPLHVMTTPKLTCFGKSDHGLRRADNEDTFVVMPELSLFLVADGMGGEAAGDLASRIFAEAAVEIFSTGKTSSENERMDLVQRAFTLAHERIREHVTKNPGDFGMGCTAELVSFLGDSCFLGHVGDSRIYLYRDDRLKQLTRDHSLIQEQLDQGLITSAEAKRHPLRNVVMRAVGVNEHLGVDLLKGRIQPGDLFLLCSDGLTDMVEETSVAEVLAFSLSCAEKGERLIELAKAAGGYDNITVVLCKVEALP
jgi:serine/threonine protein phosphatase PrpC